MIRGGVGMARWKWIAIGIVALVLLGAIAGVTAFTLTAPAADAATAFVKEIGQSGPAAAYKDAAPALRLSEDEAAFEASARAWRLTDAADASWSSRKFADGQATLTGEVKLRSGDAVPMRASLVKDGQAWKVSGLTLAAGLKSDDD
jgi:hypothetical protein